MLKRVPTVKSTFTKLDFVEAMIHAWKESYDAYPNKKQISIIFAQWSIETGQGTYCWNNNIGNSKAADVAGQIIEYCALNGVWEIINGKRVELKSENPGSWFRSFPTLDLGVEHHFNLLRNKRYTIAWAQVEAGSPSGFSKLLRQQGYYTAPEADYTRAVTAYSDAFMKVTLFEQALANVTAENFTDDHVEFEAPLDMPIVHSFVEFEPRELGEVDDGPIQQGMVGQLYNFLMMLLSFFMKKKP